MFKYILSLLILCCAPTVTFSSTSVVIDGITWTFGGDYTTGTFVNGDPWVLDPGGGVVITSISNTRHSGLDLSTVDYDGSTVDISRPLSTTGLDSRFSGYSTDLNVNKHLPYTLLSGKSLLSSISWLASDTDLPTNWTGRPWLKRIAILTCVSSTPPGGSFRPSYAASQKTIYSSASFDLSIQLPRLSPPTGLQPISTYASWVRGPLVDMFDGYGSEYGRASDNYPYNSAAKDGTYNRYVSSAVGAALLATTLNEELVGNKKDLVINIVQAGIDYYGMLLNGATWHADGGHRQGYKLPILFAGKMLNNEGMLSVGQLVPNTFQEDNHWYVDEADVAITHCGDYNGCPAPCGDAGLLITDVANRQYTSSTLGIPEWGIRHITIPCADDATSVARYRAINGLSLSSHALAANILGLKTAWNQPAFFDYHDRWMNDIKGGADVYITTAMWGTYRNSYPPVWSHTTPPPTPTSATFLPFKSDGKATKAPQ